MKAEIKPRRLLVVGGYGVVGNGIVELFSELAGWHLTTAGRREAPVQLLSGKAAPEHVRVDLLDLPAVKQAFTPLSTVTDLVFCAYTERATMAETQAPNVAMLEHTLTALQAAGIKLHQVILIGGGKSYGEHLGPYKTPAKESDARFLGPIFYNEQEDVLWRFAQQAGFRWTVLRPDGVMGPGIGSPMNMLTGLAAFAAVSRELGVPLRFPGSAGAWSALHQATDSGLLAEAVLWALTAEPAANQIFNVTNGDHFRWQHLWSDIAAFYDMPVAAPQPMSLTEQMADKAPVWQQIVAKYRLRPTTWGDIAAWPFVDGWLNMAGDMVQSTIKIRQAGFTRCIDSHDSLIAQLEGLRRYRLIP